MSNPDYLTGRLMTPMHFNSDDLALNRVGQLSEKQQRRLGDIQSSSRSMNKWGTILLAGFFGLTLGYPLLTDRAIWNNLYAVGAIVSVLVLIVGGYIVVGIINNRRMRIPDGETVHHLTETVKSINKQNSRFGTYWYLQIGHEKLYMPTQQAAEAFEIGAPYTIYYLNLSLAKVPISAEAVESFADIAG